ncbi:MAG: class I SAM-dependent methyltransferase [Myxococcota bacterium]|nr:class I SAM-dependent methyltransferase [Myxococcota bacterium]
MTTGPRAPEQLFDQKAVVTTYAARRYITPAEVRVIAECWPLIRGGRVLDIGIGAGRTIPYLAPYAAHYVGIDFMPNMVNEARRQHPGRDLRHADARALPFGDGELDFVLFSFNGLDSLAPVDRPRVLSEVRRVLRPGGSFAYSSHNLASRTSTRSAFRPELPRLSRSPIRSAVQVARGAAAAVRGYRNYRLNASLERVGDGISFIMDGAHDYSYVVCYVTQAHELQALAAAGFDVRLVIEPDGTVAPPETRARDFYFIADRR